VRSFQHKLFCWQQHNCLGNFSSLHSDFCSWSLFSLEWYLYLQCCILYIWNLGEHIPVAINIVGKHQVDSWSSSHTGEPKSVYVRNLPSDVTAAEIEEEFKHFGRIKPDGVFVRNRKVNLLSSPLYIGM
jgi:hypothetical protein